jgi:hypothetical protein
MITNGNNFHPADYHAEVTAEKIVVVGESASAETVQASRAFRKAVEAILVKHHAVVENIEQAALAEHGATRYDHDLQQCALDATDDSVLVEIAAASRGTILEAHFHRADVQAAILAELHHETRSQINVHRDVHRKAAILASGPRLVVS